MGEGDACYGLAFIVEGATDKIFYREYLSQLCKRSSFGFVKDDNSQEDCFHIVFPVGQVTVMLNSVGSVTQMANSATWFHRVCIDEYHNGKWTVFLCYDTDGYDADISKFYEGDWGRLRKTIKPLADRVIDLAAKADIEDIILCDLPGVLSFLELPDDTLIPSGNKGKTRLKKLYRMVASNKVYHSGERARSLIANLDMARIKMKAPIPLNEIDDSIESYRCKFLRGISYM